MILNDYSVTRNTYRFSKIYYKLMKVILILITGYTDSIVVYFK